VPSHASNVALPAATSTSPPSGTGALSVRRRFSTRLAAIALAGAAAVSLTACGASGGGNSSAVAVAASKAGDPYSYGAAGPNAFDCSGFTQYVYSRLGVSLPRTAAEQQAAVMPVSPSAARPGDLIFIGSPAYHVGIYAGNGQFWTAPKSGDVVKLETIWASYTVGRP
jgi:cell wall-associated NlpC family hydrolase